MSDLAEINKNLKEFADVYKKDMSELRTRVEKFEETKDSLTKEEIKNVHESLRKQEETINKMLMEKKSAENYEKKSGSDEYEEAVSNYLRKGNAQAVEEIEKKFLETKDVMRVGEATLGGYFAGKTIDDNISKKITEADPIRQFASVVAIGGSEYETWVRSKLLKSKKVGEQGPVEETNNGYSRVTITPKAYTAMVPITRDLVMDSRFDLVSELQNDAGEDIGQQTAKDNVNKIKNSLIVPNIDTKNSLAFDLDDIGRLYHQVKTGYTQGGAFGFNRAILEQIREAKGSDGQYIVQPFKDGSPLSYNGAPIVEFVTFDGDDSVAGNKIGCFGNWARGFRIADRAGISVIRDEVTQKKNRIVEYQFEMRTDGEILLPEALVVLAVKA